MKIKPAEILALIGITICLGTVENPNDYSLVAQMVGVLMFLVALPNIKESE